MTRRLWMIVAAALAIAFNGVPAAGAMDRFDIITTQQLEQMLAQREAGRLDFLLVNALDEIIFRDRCIPGSINLPWSKVPAFKDRLGADPGRLIVTY